MEARKSECAKEKHTFIPSCFEKQKAQNRTSEILLRHIESLLARENFKAYSTQVYPAEG